MLSVALIGAGRIAHVHAPNIANHPSSQLRYIVDINETAANTLAEKCDAQVCDIDAVMANNSIDVVVIASATDTHADLIEQAVLANKAVFCEKPVDLNIERVRQCSALVKEKHGRLMVGFNRRFDPSFAQLKTALDHGEIGNVELVSIFSRDPASGLNIDYLKASGGLFRDMTIHDFDMARFLLGEEPISVQATAAALTAPEIKEIGDIDTAVISLQCASGRMAVITNSRRASYGYDQRIEVHGSNGMLNVINVPESHVVKSTANGIISQKPMNFFLERYADSYRQEWNYFVNAIEKAQPLYPDVMDGQRALLIAEAAFESLKSKKAVTIEA